MNEVWTELRRRNVFRVAVAYVVLGWVLLQVASLIAPALGLPGWAFSFVLFVLIIGFPLVLIFAWAFELTPEGLKRTVDVDPQASVTLQTGRKFDFVIIGVLSMALLFFVFDRLFLARGAPPDVVRSSIAVLPFVNMSSDPEQEYFSDGISEELLNLLARTQGLRVAARTSSFAFKGQSPDIRDVGKKLDVATVLEGSVRQSGKRLRITAQLIDVASGYHLWSDTYERELTDIFAIQDEISKSIVDALHVHLGLEAPTMPKVKEANIEAYRLYLLGRHNFEQRKKETLYKAIEFFDQAIAIDPDYAPAWSGKADAWMLLETSQYGDVLESEALALAEPLIERALELDPGLAEAYASKGLFLLQSGQYETSLKAFDRAIEFNPNLARAWHWKAISLGVTSDHRGGLESWQRAHELDPLSPVILGNVVGGKIRFGQFQEAEELLERMRATAPDSYRLFSAASNFHVTQGNWSVGYTRASRVFEMMPNSLIATELGFAQLALKGFNGETPGFSQDTRIYVNAYADPTQASQDWQAMSDAKKGDGSFNKNMAWAFLFLENYEESIKLLEGLPGFTDSFPGPLFGGSYPAYIPAPVMVLARQRTGDEAGARRLLQEIDTYIKVMKGQGATWTLPLLEAELHALKGKDDAVIAALKQAHKDGYLTWFDLDFPFFDAVRDREDFQAIVRAVDAKVNAERAKLGWEPVE